jgi:peptidyl-prolyl cis-trans isomerase C
MSRCIGLLTLALVACTAAQAQQPAQEPPPPAPVPSQPPAPTVIAATVNGTPIRELDVFIGAGGQTVGRYKELRTEVLNFLIENALVDQYLDQMKVTMDAKEVDVHVEKIKAELKERGKDLEGFCKSLLITEAELRTQLKAQLRWDKFIAQYTSDKVLHDYFDANKALFDGSQMRAKHILLRCKAGDAQEVEKAKAALVLLKKEIEEKVAKGLADAGKLDNLEMQKRRRLVLEETFGQTASAKSDCPSKIRGGDLGWFSRAGGKEAEPFARTAFALKPFEMSDPVVTEMGCHLILALDSKPGLERKYEDVRDSVRDVYADRMREAIVARMRPAAKIEIMPAPK